MARSWPIYLYVPNLIGYARILANLVAFAFAFSNKKLFAGLYLLSFVCDELDGRFARLLNQTSTFGAVLDMVTDRVSTAGLLVILTHNYKGCYGLFLGLLGLDITSHWFQMYSTFLASKTSHKDVADSKSRLFRAYYQHRLFMGYCCVGAEVLYLVLYVIAEEESNNLLHVVQAAARKLSFWAFLGLLALPGWAIKQVVNFVQIRSAADLPASITIYDLKGQEESELKALESVLHVKKRHHPVTTNNV
ncbi:hypothetical protein GOP47_0013548 [Adiantum capillus-veneris]|uniref:CDP-diacylglycerol--inositol 3-phosphatidyltransferase n=1 Tax=Adiantum capillus-veneris TaxID=13818 RepID=A0A9D4UP89_ADICA|nr:hypothetical protein GOP47_0013548 [Adiantum capillus-veneris]